MDLPMELFCRAFHRSFCQKKCHIAIRFAFLNPTTIPFIILSVYTDELFSSVYLQTNFTVNTVVGKSYTSSYFFVFFIPSFPIAILSLYISIKYFHQCLSMDIAWKSLSVKFTVIHRWIKFRWCFCLYLLNFW
jgi:hypothetical protein